MTERMSLTPKQREAFDAIVGFQLANRRTPNYRELAEILGLRAKSGVSRLIDGLQERGYIERIPHRAYSITVVERAPRQAFSLPPATQAKLDAYCLLKAESADAIVADAVLFFLDDCGERISETVGGGDEAIP